MPGVVEFSSFKGADIDKSGDLKREEFAKATKTDNSRPDNMKVNDIFDAIDIDKSGSISSEEYKKFYNFASSNRGSSADGKYTEEKEFQAFDTIVEDYKASQEK
ncbi:MAG: EF-hand domain-containing protein [Pseudomonadota bacterium]